MSISHVIFDYHIVTRVIHSCYSITMSHCNQLLSHIQFGLLCHSHSISTYSIVNSMSYSMSEYFDLDFQVIQSRCIFQPKKKFHIASNISFDATMHNVFQNLHLHLMGSPNTQDDANFLPRCVSAKNSIFKLLEENCKNRCKSSIN